MLLLILITMCRDPVIKFGLDNVVFNVSSVADELGKQYMVEVSQVLMSSLRKICEPRSIPNDNNLTVFITTATPFTNIKLSTNESYELNVFTDNRKTCDVCYIIIIKVSALIITHTMLIFFSSDPNNGKHYSTNRIRC